MKRRAESEETCRHSLSPGVTVQLLGNAAEGYDRPNLSLSCNLQPCTRIKKSMHVCNIGTLNVAAEKIETVKWH